MCAAAGRAHVITCMSNLRLDQPRLEEAVKLGFISGIIHMLLEILSFVLGCRHGGAKC